MNQTLIITHAVLIGLTPLIPVPVLDDLVKAFFYRRLVELLAFRHKLRLNPSEVNILAEDRSQNLFKGCLLGTLEYVVKRLIRKLTVVLEWRRAIDMVTRMYYVGYLMDYAFQQNWYVPGDPQHALRLRSAIETARMNANTNLVKRVVQSSFKRSRAMILGAVHQMSRSLQEIAFRRSRMWLHRRLRFTEVENAQVAEVEHKVAEKMEQEAPKVEGALHGLISYLEEYLDAVQEEHQEHFEGLQNRLENALKTPPPQSL